jgi:multidrug efflux pump
VGSPISIDVSGEDFDILLRITDDFVRLIEEDRIPGIDELSLNININQPEMLIHIDREKARLFELSTQAIAGQLRNSLYGYDVGNYKDGEDEYDIFVRLKEQYRNDVSILMNQKIHINDNKIPISAVASFEYSSTYDKINRSDHKRVVTITSNVEEGFNANQINTRIKQILDGYDLPNGYTWEFSGEQQEQAESSQFLFFALARCVGLDHNHSGNPVQFIYQATYHHGYSGIQHHWGIPRTWNI